MYPLPSFLAQPTYFGPPMATYYDPRTTLRTISSSLTIQETSLKNLIRELLCPLEDLDAERVLSIEKQVEGVIGVRQTLVFPTIRAEIATIATELLAAAIVHLSSQNRELGLTDWRAPGILYKTLRQSELFDLNLGETVAQRLYDELTHIIQRARRTGESAWARQAVTYFYSLTQDEIVTDEAEHAPIIQLLRVAQETGLAYSDIMIPLVGRMVANGLFIRDDLSDSESHLVLNAYVKLSNCDTPSLLSSATTLLPTALKRLTALDQPLARIRPLLTQIVALSPDTVQIRARLTRMLNGYREGLSHELLPSEPVGPVLQRSPARGREHESPKATT